MEPNNNTNSNAQSFALYTGKAPILIQIFAGLVWLGAAGLILQGIAALLVSPIFGILFIILGVVFVLAGKAMFKMRKVAFTFCLVLGLLTLVAAIYLAATGPISYSIFISPILFLLIAFGYKSKFVN